MRLRSTAREARQPEDRLMPRRESKVRKAVIPAAGLGTRFLPATKAQPKEMLPVYDRPAIQYVVEEAVNAGIRDLLIVTGRGKQSIENHFDKSVELETMLDARGKTDLLKTVRDISDLCDILYVRQKEQLGLGHALLCGRSFVQNEPFAVFLGDDIIHGDTPAIAQLMDVFARFGGGGVLCVEEVPRDRISSYGVVKVKEKGEGVYEVLDMVEKPKPEKAPSNLGIVGRYLLTPEIFTHLDETKPGAGGEIQLTDALRALNRKTPFHAVKFRGTRYDIGNKLEYIKASLDYALRDPGIARALRDHLEKLVG